MMSGGRAVPYSRVNELKTKGARRTKARSAVKTHNFCLTLKKFQGKEPLILLFGRLASNLLLFSTILGLALASSSKKTLRIRQLQRVILR